MTASTTSINPHAPPPPLEDPSELTERERAAATQMLVLLARGEQDAAHLYAPLALRASTSTLRLAFAGVVRDELRHALLAQRLLARLGEHELSAHASLPRTHVEPDSERAAIHATPLVDELDGLVVLFLLDRAAGHRLADLARSHWAPLARAVRSMVHEEVGHVTLGNHHVRRLALQPRTRQSVQEAIDRWYVPVLATFGHDDDADAEAWHASGIQSRSVSDVRAGFMADVNELASSWRLTLPAWVPPWIGQAPDTAANTAERHRLIGG